MRRNPDLFLDASENPQSQVCSGRCARSVPDRLSGEDGRFERAAVTRQETHNPDAGSRTLTLYLPEHSMHPVPQFTEGEFEVGEMRVMPHAASATQLIR